MKPQKWSSISISLILILLCSTGKSFSQNYIPGNSYLGTKGYIEYLPGTLPIVISSPHGGYLSPADIPDRSCPACISGLDGSSQEIARDLREAFYHITGQYPFVIINLLARSKLDANREIVEAACGNADAEKAWNEYQVFIDSAEARITKGWGKGFYFDVHSHGHDIPRIELGYLLDQSTLASGDPLLNSASTMMLSSIRNLAKSNLNSYTHSQLLKGDYALGSMLADKGYRSVPGNDEPYPLATESYFNGGYNTHRHSSHNGGTIDGVQIETNHEVRSSASVRQLFSYKLALTLLEYLNIHYFPNITQYYTTNYNDSAIIFRQIDVPVSENFDKIGTEDISAYNNDKNFPGLYTFRSLGNGIPQIITKYLTSSISGKHYHFGNSSNPSDRAIGMIYSSTTGSIGFGLKFRNGTGKKITSVDISFTGEEWRSGSGGPTALNELTFEYRQSPSVTDIETGSYIKVNDLKFTAPFVGPSGSTAITLDGNDPGYRKALTATVYVDIPAGEEIMLRWSDLTDDPSYDCALAIDDLSVTPKSNWTGTGMIREDQNKLIPYPNPFTDYIQIDNTHLMAESIEIFDLTGHKMISEKAATDIIRLDVALLPAGIYIIRSRGSGKIYSRKLVKL